MSNNRVAKIRSQLVRDEQHLFATVGNLIGDELLDEQNLQGDGENPAISLAATSALMLLFGRMSRGSEKTLSRRHLAYISTGFLVRALCGIGRNFCFRY
jgi:hypothetical protein